MDGGDLGEVTRFESRFERSALGRRARRRRVA